MNKLVRFGVSLPGDLLKKFDKLIRERKYQNRSEALRDLIRKELIKKDLLTGKTATGAVLIVYDHHKRELVSKLIDIQHDYHDVIISSQHVHLDHHNCIEIIAVKGSVDKIKTFSNLLQSLKGVKQGELTLATTGKNLS
ncbi:MAG: nickel-responsive transcriptional regulator NikR [bacterium]